MNFIEAEDFKAVNFQEKGMSATEYENCSFSSCNFAQANLAGINFMECDFINCDFSNANITGSSFRDVDFRDCKMLGLRFDACNDFLLSFNFKNCQLNFSSFFKLKIKGTRFENCILEQVDFVETDLTNASFQKSNLNGAIFGRTLLKNADLQSAYNFSIDPEANLIAKAKFSTQNISGLLEKYNINIK